MIFFLYCLITSIYMYIQKKIKSEGKVHKKRLEIKYKVPIYMECLALLTNKILRKSNTHIIYENTNIDIGVGSKYFKIKHEKVEATDWNVNVCRASIFLSLQFNHKFGLEIRKKCECHVMNSLFWAMWKSMIFLTTVKIKSGNEGFHFQSQTGKYLQKPNEKENKINWNLFISPLYDRYDSSLGPIQYCRNI